MFHFYHHSLKKKLLIVFMSIGFIPSLIFLLYILYFSQTKILDKLITEHYERTKFSAKLINEHIHFLEKEVKFLSSLEVMDDLLAEDVDKKISRLLENKANDINLNLHFYILLENEILIASSKQNTHLQNKVARNQSVYIEKGILYISNEIYASFDSTKKIGTLFLAYDLNNLNNYLKHEKNIYSYIFHPSSQTIIGEKTPLDITLNPLKHFMINNNTLIVYEKLSSSLSGWYIVYGVNTDKALEFLYDFIKFILVMTFFLVITIIYISFKQSKEIFKPIDRLTQTINTITSTQNYNLRLEIKTKDEIAILSKAFNTMIQTTSESLEKLQKEKELIKKTRSSSNEKSIFISSMSHELRTPLNSIIGSTQYLLIYEKMTKTQEDNIATIESSAEYLLGMINDILDIAKIEAGKIDLHKEYISLKEMLEQIYEMMSPLMYDKGLKFETIASDFEDIPYLIDSKIFKQIMINLLSNAIKFTDSGSISVTIKNKSDTISICIKDTGIGIEPHLIKNIFHPFMQIENKLQTKQQGTGLGLSISQKLAKLLQAEIIIESDGINKGLSSSFILPLKSVLQ